MPHCSFFDNSTASRSLYTLNNQHDIKIFGAVLLLCGLEQHENVMNLMMKLNAIIQESLDYYITFIIISLLYYIVIYNTHCDL